MKNHFLGTLNMPFADFDNFRSSFATDSESTFDFDGDLLRRRKESRGDNDNRRDDFCDESRFDGEVRRSPATSSANGFSMIFGTEEK